MNLEDRIKRIKLQKNYIWLEEIIQIFQQKDKNQGKFSEQQLETVKSILLEQIEHLRNITLMVEQDNSKEDVLEKYLSYVSIEKFSENQFIYHQRDQCEYVYLVLDGLVTSWEPKQPQDLLKEMDLTNKKNNIKKKFENCRIAHEKEFYQLQIKELENQLKQYRILEEDKFLRSEEKRYFPLPNTTNFKRVKFIVQGNFIGESESIFGSKMEHTYVSFMDTYVLKIKASRFSGIFNLQMKKVGFSYEYLNKAFPNANQDSLTWLSYQADEEYYLYNQKIFEEGDNLKCLYMIRSGSVQIKKIQYYDDETVNNTKKTQKSKKIQIAILGAGEIIGSEALYSSKKGMQYEAMSYEAPFARIYKFTKAKLDKIIYKLDDIKLKLDLKRLGKNKLKWIEEREANLQNFNNKIQEEKNILVKHFRKVKKAQTVIRNIQQPSLPSEKTIINQSQSLIQDQFSSQNSPLKRYQNDMFNQSQQQITSMKSIPIQQQSIFKRSQRQNQTTLIQMNQTFSQKDLNQKINQQSQFQRNGSHKISVLLYPQNEHNKTQDHFPKIEEEDINIHSKNNNILQSNENINSNQNINNNNNNQSNKNININVVTVEDNREYEDEEDENNTKNNLKKNYTTDRIRRDSQNQKNKIIQQQQQIRYRSTVNSFHQNREQLHNQSLPLLQQQNNIKNSQSQTQLQNSNQQENFNNYYNRNNSTSNAQNQIRMNQTVFYNNSTRNSRNQSNNTLLVNKNNQKMYKTHNIYNNEYVNTSHGYSPQSRNNKNNSQNQSINNSQLDIPSQNNNHNYSSTTNLQNITQNLTFKDINSQKELQQLFQQETSREKVSYQDFVNEVRYIKRYEKYKKNQIEEDLVMKNPEMEQNECENLARKQKEVYNSRQMDGQKMESFINYKERILQNVIFDQKAPLLVMDKKLYDQNAHNVEFQFRAKKMITEQLLNNQKLNIKSVQTPVVNNINRDLSNIQKQYAKLQQKQIRINEFDDGINSEHNAIKDNRNFQFHYLSQLPSKNDLETLKHQFDLLEQKKIEELKLQNEQQKQQQHRKNKWKSMDFMEQQKRNTWLKPVQNKGLGMNTLDNTTIHNNNNYNSRYNNINKNNSINSNQTNIIHHNKFNNTSKMNNSQLSLHKKQKNYENLSIGIDFIYSDKTQKNVLFSYRNKQKKNSLDQGQNQSQNQSQIDQNMNQNNEISIIEPNQINNTSQIINQQDINNLNINQQNYQNNSNLKVNNELNQIKNTQDYINSLENEMENKYEKQQKQLLDINTSPYTEQNQNKQSLNSSLLNNQMLSDQQLQYQEESIIIKNVQSQEIIKNNENSNNKNNNKEDNEQFFTQSQKMFNQTVNFKNTGQQNKIHINKIAGGTNINQRQRNIKALQINSKQKKLLLNL